MIIVAKNKGLRITTKTLQKLSVRQACKLIDLPRLVFRHKRVAKDDSVLMSALEELVSKHPTIGFWKRYYRLCRQVYEYNHKRLYRVYKLLKLNVRRKIKRRLPQPIKQLLVVPDALNLSCCLIILLRRR